MSVHNKFQAIRFSRLAGQREHLYMNVLLYYIDCQYSFVKNLIQTLKVNSILAKPFIY